MDQLGLLFRVFAAVPWEAMRHLTAFFLNPLVDRRQVSPPRCSIARSSGGS
jgi:hypothetical protein